jgi:type IV fimbrial biogenesis protein FimT
MVTLAVVAVLLGVGVPAFQALVKDNRLTTAASAMIDALNLARSEAIKRGANVSVQPLDGIAWASGVAVVVALGAENVRVTEFSANSPMTFDPVAATYTYRRTGQLLIPIEQTITLCDDRTKETGRQITIEATGSARSALYLGCT